MLPPKKQTKEQFFGEGNHEAKKFSTVCLSVCWNCLSQCHHRNLDFELLETTMKKAKLPSERNR